MVLFEKVAELLYDDGRCGFFHDGMSRGRIFISGQHDDIVLATIGKDENGIIDLNKIKSLVINPKKLLAAIEWHFRDYLIKLRDQNEKELRSNFYKMADEKWNFNGQGTEIGINSHENI